MCLTTDRLRSVGVRYDKLTSIDKGMFEIEINNPKGSSTYMAKMKLYFNICSIYTINNTLHIAFTSAMNYI